jgi:hypothetical protein
MYPNGNGGFISQAKGTRKGEDRVEAEKNWGRTSPFYIPEVAEDGTLLVDELRDLNRDAARLAMAERVSHGAAGEQAPGFELDGLSDEEVDAKLHEYLRGREDTL